MVDEIDFPGRGRGLFPPCGKGRQVLKGHGGGQGGGTEGLRGGQWGVGGRRLTRVMWRDVV